MDEGKLWSLIRNVLQQGAAMQLDSASIAYETYSARLDFAASERVAEFMKLAAAPPAPVVEVTDEQCVQAYRIKWAHEPLALDIDAEDIEWSKEWLRAWQQVLGPTLGLVTREEYDRLRVALRDCAQKAEALKQPCGDDPESAQAVRNAQYQAISSSAHLALGTIKGSEMYVTREELTRVVETAYRDGYEDGARAESNTERHEEPYNVNNDWQANATRKALESKK